MQTVADILKDAVERSPTDVALISDGQEVSYADLFERARRIGTEWHAQGIRRGDRILTLLQNHHCAAVLHWAAQLYGVVICPINWRATPTELAYFLQDSGAKAIFFDDSSARAVADFERPEGVQTCKVQMRSDDGQLWPETGAAPFAPLPQLDETDISVLLYTSGTTGPGKGVPRSHRAERAAALAHVAQNALLFGDIALGVMPLYHTMGVRILLTTAALSGVFVCQPRFEPDVSLDLIARHRVRSLYLVPTLYHDMLLSLEHAPTDVSSIARLGFAGASMSDGLLARLTAAFPGRMIVNHYGSSEIYTYTITQDAAAKPGSAGRAGLNSNIAVIPLGSEDVTARAAVGTEGQVIAALRSNEAFEGYLNRPDADAAAIKDGWYLTGDVGFLDAQGDLFLTGRVDDMIITGGENVMPIEIESVLSLHPNVSEAIIVGKPDARLGQKLTAFVVARGKTCADTLDAHCRTSGLPGYRCPKDYHFIQEIPKSPVGKILRRLL